MNLKKQQFEVTMQKKIKITVSILKFIPTSSRSIASVMRSSGLGCAGITPAGLCLRICRTTGVLRPAQTPEYFSSRNELLSQGSDLDPDCHVLALVCVGSGQALVPAAAAPCIPHPH